MIEVELKAHVEDPLQLRSKIEHLDGISSGIAIDMSDTYFYRPGVLVDDTLFRLRLSEGKGIVTRKTRRLEGAMEVNDEIEYEVSDPDAFIEYAFSLGNEIYVKKAKHGYLYRLGVLSVGLWEVSPLGWFIEVEVLVESVDAVLVEEAKRLIFELLERLQIPSEAHESRYYMEMLLEE